MHKSTAKIIAKNSHDFLSSTQQFWCFFVDFRVTEYKIKKIYLFPVLPRFCRNAKVNRRKFFLSDNKLQIKPAPYFLVFLFTGLTSFLKFLLPTATRATYE